MSVAREMAEACRSAAQLKAKACYDRTAKRRFFQVNDRVMLLRPSKANRLDVQWEGPAEVVQKLSDTYYAVKILGRRKEVKVYHVNLMKPYLERQAVVCLSLDSYEEMPIEFPVFRELDRSEATSAEMQKIIKDLNLTSDQVRDLRNLIQEFRDPFSDKPERTDMR